MDNINMDDPDVSIINVIFGLRDNIPVILRVEGEDKVLANSDMLDILMSQLLVSSLANNGKDNEKRALRHCDILMGFVKGGDEELSKKFDQYFGQKKNPMKI